MGLLDGILGTSWDDPRTAAVFAAANGIRSGDLPGGLLAMSQAMGPDAQLKRALTKAQMENLQSEVTQRNAAIQQQQDARDFRNKLFAGQLPGMSEPRGPVPDSAFKPAADGMGPVMPASMQGQPPLMSMLGQLNEDTLVQAIATGALPQGTEKLWEIAKFGKDYKQGDFRIKSDGTQSMVPMVKEGLSYGPEGVSVLPGAARSQAQLALATELPKVLANKIGEVNLRPGDNGKQYPVPALLENPILQQIFGANFGTFNPGGQPQPAQQSAPPAGASPTRGNPPAGSGIVAPQSPVDRVAILQGQLAQANQAINSGTLNDADRERMQRDAADIQGELSKMSRTNGQPNALASQIAQGGTPNPQGGYGKTTQQENDAKSSLKFGETMADQQAQALDKSATAAQTAAKDMLGIQQARKAIQGGVFMGNGAEMKLNLAKFINANVPFVTLAPEKTANTDYLKSQLGQGLLEQAKTLGSNPSNADANRINDIVGSIGKDPNAMAKILDWRQEMAARSIALHNSKVDQVEQSGYKAPFDMRVKNPLETQGRTVLRTGTLNGKKVIQYSDGTTSYAN